MLMRLVVVAVIVELVGIALVAAECGAAVLVLALREEWRRCSAVSKPDLKAAA